MNNLVMRCTLTGESEEVTICDRHLDQVAVKENMTVSETESDQCEFCLNGCQASYKCKDHINKS